MSVIHKCNLEERQRTEGKESDLQNCWELFYRNKALRFEEYHTGKMIKNNVEGRRGFIEGVASELMMNDRMKAAV